MMQRGQAFGQFGVGPQPDRRRIGVEVDGTTDPLEERGGDLDEFGGAGLPAQLVAGTLGGDRRMLELAGSLQRDRQLQPRGP